VLSSEDVAIWLNVAFRGIVGFDTMYAPIPTCAVVLTTSSTAHAAAAISAIVVATGGYKGDERARSDGLSADGVVFTALADVISVVRTVLQYL